MYINTTHKLKLIMDWEEKMRGIGHFQSYLQTQNNSLSGEYTGLGGERKRHRSLPVIHAH